MRGNAVYQADTIIKSIYEPGQSRHEAKQEAIERLEEKGEAITKENISKETGIYSTDTKGQYTNTFIELVQDMRENGNKDATLTNNDDLQNFLDKKIEEFAEKDNKLSTFNQLCSELNKIEVAINTYNEKNNINHRVDFKDTIATAKEDAKNLLRSEKKEGGGFENSRQVIDNIKNSNFNLCARIQLEGGARLKEVQIFNKQDLKGIQKDPHTSKERGFIHLTRTKGGRPRTINVSVKTYKDLKEKIQANNGSFSVNRSGYCSAVRRASLAEFEKRNGTHNFRFSYAQNRMSELQRSGQSYDQARQAVSYELGHNRASITEIYLR